MAQSIRANVPQFEFKSKADRQLEQLQSMQKLIKTQQEIQTQKQSAQQQQQITQSLFGAGAKQGAMAGFKQGFTQNAKGQFSRTFTPIDPLQQQLQQAQVAAIPQQEQIRRQTIQSGQQQQQTARAQQIDRLSKIVELKGTGRIGQFFGGSPGALAGTRGSAAFQLRQMGVPVTTKITGAPPPNPQEKELITAFDQLTTFEEQKLALDDPQLGPILLKFGKTESKPRRKR